MVPSISLYFFYLQSIGATSRARTHSRPRGPYPRRTRPPAVPKPGPPPAARTRRPDAGKSANGLLQTANYIFFVPQNFGRLAAARETPSSPAASLFQLNKSKNILILFTHLFFRSRSRTLTQPVRLSGRSQNSRGATSRASAYPRPRCSHTCRTRPHTYQCPRYRQPNAREDPCLYWRLYRSSHNSRS